MESLSLFARNNNKKIVNNLGLVVVYRKKEIKR